MIQKYICLFYDIGVSSKMKKCVIKRQNLFYMLCTFCNCSYLTYLIQLVFRRKLAKMTLIEKQTNTPVEAVPIFVATNSTVVVILLY